MARADVCRGCGTDLPPGALYCLKCGLGQSAPLIDLVRIDSAAGVMHESQHAVVEQRGPHLPWRRSLLTAVVALVVLWAAVEVLSGGDAGRKDEAGDSTTTQPEETTTRPPPRRTTTTWQSPVIDAQITSPGPVLGTSTGGRALYVVSPSNLVRVALDSGAITARTNAFRDCPPCSPAIGHTVGATVVDGRLVIARDGQVFVVETDLRDDARQLEGVTFDGRWSGRLLTVRTSVSPAEPVEVRESDPDGHVLRTWTLPPEAEVVGAVGDRLVAESGGRIYLVSDSSEAVPYAVGEVIYAGNSMLLWRHCDDHLACSISLDDIDRRTSTILSGIDGADVHDFGEPVAPDGRTAAVRVGNELRLVDVLTGTVLAGLDGVTHPAWSFTQPAWSPDGAWFFTSHDENSLVALSTRGAAPIVIPMPEGVSLGTHALVLVVG
jgi:hypothetical protein